MQKKKKLLITTDCFLPRWDGITRFLVDILPALVKEYHVTILAPDFEGSVDYQRYPWLQHIELVRFPLFYVQIGDIYFSNVTYSAIQQHVSSADIIFNQTLGPIGIFTISAARRCKKKVISYVHSLEWELATKSVKRGKFLAHVLSRLVVRYLYNRCHLLLVPTAEVMEKLSILHVKTTKHILPLGTDAQVFIPTSQKNLAKKTLGFLPSDFVVGFVGRLGREKDLTTLYRAFRRLEKNIPSAKLLIVGVGVRELERMLHGKKNVMLVGKQDNVVPYLQAMDVYVLPSLTETTSLSTLEAMSCGLPVVCTPVGYVKEYVHDGVNGYLFPFKHVSLLYQRLLYLAEHKTVRQRFGIAARKTVLHGFTLQKKLQQLQRLLHSFVKR